MAYGLWIAKFLVHVYRSSKGILRKWNTEIDPPLLCVQNNHDDVIKWKNFTCYWPFVRGIHRSPVNSPHKGQWHGALMFPLICAWINAWVNNREGGDLRCHRTHYDVTVMITAVVIMVSWNCITITNGLEPSGMISFQSTLLPIFYPSLSHHIPRVMAPGSLSFCSVLISYPTNLMMMKYLVKTFHLFALCVERHQHIFWEAIRGPFY